MVLNNISTAITLDELLKIETSKEYTITDWELKFDNDPNKKDFDIEYTNTSFYGSHCVKNYFFVDEELESLIFDIDTSHWMPKNIYKELVKLNGEPDETELKSDKLGTDYYTWYGKNGTLIMTDDNISRNIEVCFQLE